MEAPWITRMAVLSGAGWGVEPILAHWGADLRREAPWAWEKLGARGVVGIPAAALGLPLGAVGRAGAALDRVVSAVLPEGVGRVGLVIGTSSGAISGDFEAWRRSGEPDRAGWRQLPGEAVAARHGLAPVVTVSVACASGAAVFAVALAWINAGVCDHVVVAGLDVLSPYIHAGFAGLGALSAGRSHPFTAGRDGLVLGEGAAAFLVESPAAAAGRVALTTLRGVGLTQDGVHLTAPDRTGSGLARAGRHALEQAGITPDAVGTVSAHGTGTPFNDAMEARALVTLFGSEPVPLHATKPVVGHTLGAAGAIEAAVAIAVLGGARVPGPPDVDPELGLRLRAPDSRPFALSLNAAFGGVNAAVVFGPPGEVHLHPAGAPASVGELVLDEASFPLATLRDGEPVPPVLGRADNYTRAAIAALARLRPRVADLFVLDSRTNCHAADLRFYDGLLLHGPSGASRTAFVYTLPGAPLAEAAILLGLRGAALTTCGVGAAEALATVLLPILGGERAWAVELEAPSHSAHIRVRGPLPGAP